MTRIRRLALEIFGPPLLGWMLSYAAMAIMLLWRARGDLAIAAKEMHPVVLLYGLGVAFIIAGLPSLAYAAIMEIRFARGLSPRSRRAVLLSTSLGAFAGLAMSVVVRKQPVDAAAVGIMMGTGAIVGFAIASLIRIKTPEEARA
jgi:hypothetical protein